MRSVISGPSRDGRRLVRTLWPLAAALALGACSTRGVAHVDWQRGAGPAMLDVERPVIVDRTATGVDVLFPVLFYAEAEGRYFGPCGLRAAKLDSLMVDSILKIGDVPYDGAALGDPALLPGADPVEVVGNERIQVRRWSRTVPLASGDVDSTGALAVALYVEVEALATATAAAAAGCTGVSGTRPGGPVRAYLVELGSARAEEGVAWNLAAAWWAVLALGTLLASGR